MAASAGVAPAAKNSITQSAEGAATAQPLDVSTIQPPGNGMSAKGRPATW